MTFSMGCQGQWGRIDMTNKGLIGVNVALAAMFLALGVLVDGNGRILGLSEAQSAILTVGVSVPALCAAGVLIAKGSGWKRALGIGLEMLYVALMLPIIMP